MYSRAVADDRLNTLLKSPLGAAVDGKVERLPVSQCLQLTRQLASALDPKKGLTRQLTVDEQWFIRNERVLTKVDYRHWAERYCMIIRPDKGVSPMFPLWESQELMLAALASEEEDRYTSGHPDGLVFNILKGRQLGCCLDPETRVLTADLRWVRIDDLVPGVEVIGIDEHPQRQGAARKMRTGVVEARRDVLEPAFAITLDDGRVITATAPHRFLYRTRTQVNYHWRAVADFKIGGHLRYAVEPWEAPSVEDGWMGGMLDGEGSCNAKKSGGVEISVSQLYGAVYDRAHMYLRERGYSIMEKGETEASAIRANKFGRRPVGKLSVARMNEAFRLLGVTRPTRFIGRRWWEGKELAGKRQSWGLAKIVAIRPLGVRRMVDLQTSTKTFLADGIVSHNSTLCQSAIAHRGTTQSYTKGMIASDVPENSGSTGLFGMLELTVEHLPWWLKPQEKFHTKNQHIIWSNHSSVVVEAGKSMKGGLQDEGGQKGQLGRSKTYTCVHLSELSTWEYADTIDDSLDPAIARTPRTFWAKESTAKGRHNWWHNEWEATEKGYGRSFNIFIPWYAERSKYWLPTPEGWEPPAYCLDYAARVNRSAPRWMRRSFELSKEQLFWYYKQYEAAQQKGVLYKFFEEYPAEPAEAFQYSGRSIFSPEQIDKLRNCARPLRNVYLVQPASLITEFRDQAFEEARVHKETVAAKQGPVIVKRRMNDPANPEPVDNSPQAPAEVLS